jgi:ATP-dependent DNA helicase RecQ
VAEARSTEQQTMIEYASTTACRMEFLRRCLDDPEATTCGRCDNCAEPLFDAEVSAAALAAADAFLGRPGVQIAPKKMWPTGLSAVKVPLKGKIAPSEQIEAGRAVGRLSDFGWGARLRAIVGPQSADGPISDELGAAVVEILKAWAHGDDAWAQRPAAVVEVASRSHPQLIHTLAEHIARVGRLPLLGAVTVASPPPLADDWAAVNGQAANADGAAATHREAALETSNPGGAVQRGGTDTRANSAQRVRALHDAFTVPPELSAALSALTGPVLLVDDLVDSGWTMALAGRALRRAGAEGVLPLAFAVAA